MTTGTKTDLTKTLDGYRARIGEFRLLELPPSRYLAIDGHGDPNTAPAYAEALEALYPVAYALKFASRRELDRDYVVPPWRACGGRTTWTRSRPPATSPAGTGR